MGILIKGVDMPKNCYECPFGLLEYTSQCYAKTIRNKFACCITHKTKTSTKRNRFCPLEELPTAEKKGKWIEEDIHSNWSDWTLYFCSECGRQFKDLEERNFCPNCGARMEKHENI